MLSDIIWSPAFRPEELESERQVILEEILMHADEPADLVHDVFAEAMFPGHPLGREVLGEQATVSAMKVGRISAFHHRHYQPANMVVAAAGRLDHERIASAISARIPRRAGGYPPHPRAPRGAAAHPQRPGTPDRAGPPGGGLPAPDRDHEDRHALSVVEHVLGGGMSSRLFQSIREERGLAYSVYSYRAGFEDAGALSVYAGTSPSNVSEVLGLIQRRARLHGGRRDHRGRDGAARGHLPGPTALGLEDSGARMSRIGYSQLVHGRVLDLDEVGAAPPALTADGVDGWQEVALSTGDGCVRRPFRTLASSTLTPPVRGRRRSAARGLAVLSGDAGISREGRGNRRRRTDGLDGVRRGVGGRGLELVAAVDPGGEVWWRSRPRPEPVLISSQRDVVAEGRAEVAVDFTVPAAAVDNAEWCARHGIHVVIGTTGIDQASLDLVRAAFPRPGPRLSGGRPTSPSAPS